MPRLYVVRYNLGLVPMTCPVRQWLVGCLVGVGSDLVLDLLFFRLTLSAICLFPCLLVLILLYHSSTTCRMLNLDNEQQHVHKHPNGPETGVVLYRFFNSHSCTLCMELLRFPLTHFVGLQNSCVHCYCELQKIIVLPQRQLNSILY